MDKKTRNALIISIIALLIFVIGISYAYFGARITGLESASTLSLSGGRMVINYAEGDESISAQHIYPREEEWITKTFSLTGWNNTSQNMPYFVGLNVTTNTFPNDYLTYDLTLVSSNNGTPIATTTNNPINGTGKVRFGTGTFTNANGSVHSYELKIYFKDNGQNQNDAQRAVLNATIYVEEAILQPQGWDNPASGSLVAGIKSNNRMATETITLPGKEKSASGMTDYSYDIILEQISDVKYAPTIADLRNNTNVTHSEYDDDAELLAGNYIEVTDLYEWQNAGHPSANVGSIYYVSDVQLNNDMYSAHIIGPVITAMHNETEAVMGVTEDDYGTSFYYRGAVENNYLVFANMCWRIVRVDGLGNTKITLYNYNPTSAANPCNSSLDGTNMAFARASSNSSSDFNSRFSYDYDRNTYIGYMRSNNPNSNDYLTAHANDTDSIILTYLKNWYDRVFTSAQKSQLTDVIWCNDKRYESDTSYNPFDSSFLYGLATGSEEVFYLPFERLYPSKDSTPSLKCGISKTDNLISKFTASTSTDGGYGNGALNGYKIGLLTADEVAFAGATDESDNSTYYLYKNSNEDYWTLSPGNTDDAVWNMAVTDTGRLARDIVTTQLSVRPAVSLRSDVTISGGVGTQSNPFVVNIEA